MARWHECHYQAQRLALALVPLAARHAALRAQLVAAPLLATALAAAAPADVDEVARRQRWLTRLTDAATDALAPAAPDGPTAATLLAARRAAWLYEADWLTAQLGG